MPAPRPDAPPTRSDTSTRRPDTSARGPQLTTVKLSAPQAVPVVSAAVWRPARDDGRAAVVLAPGAGSDLGHPVTTMLAESLAALGYPVVAFNFAHTETGRRAPDGMPRLLATFRDVVAAAPRLVGDRPLVLGGRSLGGRVASLLVAEGLPAAGLLLLNYPLHPPRRPEQLRTDHWLRIHGPVLFVVGTRDPLCDPRLLDVSLPALAGAAVTVCRVVGGDHAFAVRRRDGRSAHDVRTEITEAVADWLAGAVGRGTLIGGSRRKGAVAVPASAEVRG